MKKHMLPVGLATLLSCVSFADTIELADGTLLEGSFVGMSNGIMMFNTGAGIEAFPEDEVVAIYNSEGVATRVAEQKAAPAPAPEAKSPPKPKTITVTGGTRLVIRMSEAIDTRRHSAGHRSRAQLESALTVNGTTVAPRGTMVYGRTARAAPLGGLYGGSSSDKKGAKIGLGASILTCGASINIPAGNLVETNLRAPLTVPL
jgi:hypothetical protein